ncbi:LOW QUALITY PROTEIN: protein disulfide-isomerase A4-like [Paramacrobiotus metropolitanus]|uniref:LOW QUALITY PROTEIN: protein disulfide-isomerase A4-like n=1 Tax=Paramacrobiotus metropolitanus TaxID=2943436 RepID=UPI0024458E41|nr:LOW QUALITY PROTEIN: protein disulfide-isomerase A4-like [Paramacrobiotus metropolitanus]
MEPTLPFNFGRWLLYLLVFPFLVHSKSDNVGQDSYPKMDIKLDNEVYVMTEDNFHHLIQGHETGLVLFHVPWNAQYRSMLPEYEKVTKKVNDELPSVLMGKLDVSLHPEIAEQLDIRGDEPQFLFFHQGKPYNYEDFKSYSALLESLRLHAGHIWFPPRPHPELVPELTQHEFQQTIKGLDFAVVAFYRANCPSCVRLLLEYETAVVNLTDKVTDKIRFFKTNLDDAPSLTSEYEITDVPTLKVFRKGKVFGFNSREKLYPAILQYINRQMQPPYKQLKSIEEAEGWIRSYPNKGAVLGVFDTDKHENMEVFLDVANYLRDQLNFAFVKSKAPTGDWQISVYPPLRHVSPADKKNTFSTRNHTEHLVDFIKKKSRPLVGQRTMRNKDTLYNDRPLLIGYMNVDWSKAREHDTQYHRDKISQMVHGFPEFTFCISDRNEFKHELVRMNLEQHKEDVLLGLIGKNGEYYAGPVVDIMNLKLLTDFASNYQKNKLKPFHRTQSPPTHDDSDDYAVKVIVGATFRKLVLRHDKEVLLLMHRPSCPACKKAMNTFHDIAEEKEYPHVVFATMDTYGNDAPARFTTNTTYPMMYFVSYDKSLPPVPYPTRIFTKEKMKEFIENNAHKHKVRTEL